MDVITLKKAISLLLVCICMVGLFTACKEDPTPMTFTKEGVVQVAITTPEGKNASLTKAEEITAFLQAVENTKCITDTELTHSLPTTEQYKFTLYSKDKKAIHTFCIFSDEYMQLDTILYKGSIATLKETINGYFNQPVPTLDSLETLSPVFTSQAEDITEIAFYNVIENSFKLVTVKEDIESILSPMKALKISETAVEGDPTEEYIFYVRLKDSNQYLSPIYINKHSTGSSFAVDSTTVPVSNFKWSVLYEKLAYNTMPINQ